MNTNVYYRQTPPSPLWLSRRGGLKRPDGLIVIYDKKLTRNPAFRSWRRRFSLSYGVDAGENLKTLESFSGHVEKILPLTAGLRPADTVLVAAGGGSVGDFCGFLASVLKRGVPLIHLPTTWLAGLDSAHGGKNALNVGSYKNQIGTFYPASATVVVRSFLRSLDHGQVLSAYGELVKVAVIEGGKLLRSVEELSPRHHGRRDLRHHQTALWRLMPQAVDAKYRVVGQDPYEKKGVRQVLNLGHTLGHALESHFQWPHGLAVAFGLRFSLEWSFFRGMMRRLHYERLKHLMDKLFPPREQMKGGNEKKRKLTAVKLSRLISQDKKAVAGEYIQFVFVQKPGQVVTKKVSFQEVVGEARRQRWIK